ncbi:hypothetical protein CEXT_779761 [Caerostris extrusa]|uniref:Uncharacterized protein n=1 Tax=Caerostris extrusa TaxID=172846 RepID=A0AAV4NZ98_CAEEX|nr:hypothetical protein CEXT_779761 [Caerostris extrusa]
MPEKEGTKSKKQKIGDNGPRNSAENRNKRCSTMDDGQLEVAVTRQKGFTFHSNKIKKKGNTGFVCSLLKFHSKPPFLLSKGERIDLYFSNFSSNGKELQ